MDLVVAFGFVGVFFFIGSLHRRLVKIHEELVKLNVGVLALIGSQRHAASLTADTLDALNELCATAPADG